MDNRFATLTDARQYFNSITAGEVIDTNDPQQMGRLRVMCPALGDNNTLPVSSLPWAIYASPFAGAMISGTKGRGNDQVSGPTTYGMWNIPKIGAHVLVGCIDGDPSQRFWFAAIYPQFLTHTQPHGRFTYSTQEPGKPEGPLDSQEHPINPLYTNQTTAFTSAQAQARSSYEFRTRGADIQSARLDGQFIGISDDPVVSKLADDRNIQYTSQDGKTYTSNQGYGQSRIEPDVVFPNTGGINWDPQSYCYSTPGGHAISMDDRADNCRIRIRTTGGHQIILDDTNERIYVSTSQGNNWFEMDEQGTVSLFCSQDFSVHAQGDINFTTNKTFRVTAQEGIHLASEGEIRTDAKGGDYSIHSSGTLRIHANSTVNVEGDAGINVFSNNELNLYSAQQMNLYAGGMIVQQGSQIHFNGPTPTQASVANDKAAYYISSMPQHEGWARSYLNISSTDSDTVNGPLSNIQQEYTYNSPLVGTGSQQRSITFSRNPLWRR